MANFTLPHFGPIDPGDLEPYYETAIIFNNRKIEIDLNFKTKTIDPKLLETVQHFIDNIRIFDINNKSYIAHDYSDKDGDTVKFYLQHHLEELGNAELAVLLPHGSKKHEHEKLLLQQLHLVRVGIYPDSSNKFGIFNYTLGREMTDDLVVIFTDKNGNLNYITMER